jgi:AraC family transcriptional regulator, regulatory protein of adaptative response / methylated-DNA-[protein]-cysteine methyltransferase
VPPADHHDLVARAIAWLDDHATEQPDLAALATEVGMSPSHLQRVFTRWVGVSPKRYVQFLTAEAARGMLAADATVLDTTMATGLSSPGRLHDLMVSIHAVTPGEAGRLGDDLVIRSGVHATPFGPALVGVTDRGVCHLAFVDDVEAARADLRARWPRARHVDDRSAGVEVVARVFGPRARNGEPQTNGGLPLPVLLQGTNLQVQVWRALLAIPPGAAVSYGDVASAIGRPGAVRAVAGAVAANRVGVIIPCHRVLRANGDLSGYRWGPARKRRLLAVEAARRTDSRG